MAMTQEEKRQLMVKSLKEKLIASMKKIKSSDDTISNILYSISDEAERNLLKILDYCKEQFEYQCYYFNLDNTIFIPNIYRIKNNTFYICKFNDIYTGSDRKKIINQFIEQYPQIKIKQLSLKQYRRILKWFQDDILFESEKYKVNFSLDNKHRIKCSFCGKKFVTTNKKDKYCSDECAKKAQNKPHKSTLRKYYFGYYMDIHHYVRSGWEHNIARILQWCQLDYDYECTTFKLSNGTVYIPDFYVYADDTYYEVKGEIRTNTLTKYNMFREEYPDKKLVIIDGKIYNDLLQQFPNINFNLHVSVKKNKFNNNRINNVTKYRHDQIYYHEWELNYEFYTNKRINNETNLQIFIHLNKQVQDTLNLSYYQIMHLVKIGQIEYIMQDQQYLFNIKQVKNSIENTSENDNDILDLLNIENNFFNNKNLHITETTDINSLDINSADKNILIILQYLSFETYYEHNIFDLKNDWLVSKIYLPFDQYYYFCRFDYDSDLQNKIMYKLSKSDVKYHIISKQEYYELIRRFLFLFNDSSLINEALNAEKINNNNTKEELYCLYCHQLIDKRKMKNSYKPKFCSRKCHRLYEQEKNETRTFCLNCNKKIVVKNSREIHYHQFCSDACALEYKDKMDQQLINSNSLTSTTSSKLSFQVGICKNCNKQFYYVGNNKKHFCSDNCLIIYNRKKVHEKQCVVCKKTFMTKDHSQTCCSTKCVRILQHQYGKQQLLEKNKLTINNLKRIIIAKPADINNIPSKNARILATLLLSQFNQPLEYENHTVRLNDTLIICQFYSAYNGKFYFVKNDVRHQREKINQYMETNPDHNFVLIDQKILQLALKTNKLVLNAELDKYYTFKEALNLFNTSTKLLEQRLRRHSIPVFIDELFSTKLVLKENIDKLLQ